jgi:stage II sporulation protein D
MFIVRRLTVVALVASALAAPGAHAAALFAIRGGGDGHGIGMSQWGADGYAEHGKSYRFILAHYYRHTGLGIAARDLSVRVLLSPDGQPSFRGADTRFGKQRLKPATTYTVRPNADGTLVLVWIKKTRKGPRQQNTGPFTAPLSVAGPGPLELIGRGSYRGSLVFRPAGGNQVQTVNQLGLEDYVRGVVSAESPATWPAAALRAQAVAARTYAITSSVGNPNYDVYQDTRSQMYLGVAAETPATNAAVATTAGQVVTYRGSPVITYFSASSGGHTESIQNVWSGYAPEPWLVGVPDPYDGADHNPYHHWAYDLRLGAAQAKLGGLLNGKGSLIGIRVISTGASRRVIRAEVVGANGSTAVTGTQLQRAFGLLSNLASFTTITTSAASDPVAALTNSPSNSAGGAQTRAVTALVPLVRSILVHALPGLSGTVFPAVAGDPLVVQLRDRHRWRTVIRTRLATGGGYYLALPGRGTYRVRYAGIIGPAVRVS